MGCIEFATWLPEAIREKDISIRNLQRLLFGETGGKKKKKKKKNQSHQKNSELTPSTPTSNDPAANDSSVAADSADPSEPGISTDPPPISEQTQNVVKGHGRLGHSAYLTALNISVSLGTVRAGDACPGRCGGRLCFAKPGFVIRIPGNACRYRLEKLRCGLCGCGVAAPLPPNVPAHKYDSAFKANLAIQKYYVALPFYRQEQVQRLLGFPLPDATQFELVEQVANAGYPVVSVLEKTAANGEVVHNDDTQAKILSVIQENKAQPDKARTGMQTTGLIVKAESHTIALYYTGTRHAGENLEAVLRHRHPDLSPIIQMCDAASLNIPKSLETILCHCLAKYF